MMTLNEWFLSSKFSSIPEIIFYDIFQWLRFFLFLLICFLAKITAYAALNGLWFYKIFVVILLDPDKIFDSRKPSPRALNRYKDKGYTPIQAYSRRYLILSCYQLHEYIDNGFCRLFHWLRSFLEHHERSITRHLFLVQDYFFPHFPTEGLIVDTFSFLTRILVISIFSILAFFEFLITIFLKKLVCSYCLMTRITRKLQRFLTTDIWILSSFSRVIPAYHTLHSSNVFLTDVECIKRCYESEISDPVSLVNFMNEKCEAVYVDNCANCHITNTKAHFISYTPFSDADFSGLVNTIDGNTKPAGVGTVRWSWRDDEGKISTYDLPGCRYYPESPVCILSQTQLGLFLNDRDFGTKIESGIHTSIFHWDNQRFCRTIKHTTSYMPKMIINDDHSSMASFFTAFRSVFDDNAGYSLLTEQQLSLDFEKLIGKEVQYVKGDFRSKAVILSVTPDKVFTIQLTDGSKIDTHHNFITILPVEAPSTQTTLPRSLAETIAHRLQEEPELGLPKANEKLSLDQKELLRWHIRLGHLPFKSLLVFAQLGLIPRHLAKVDTIPLCASCTVAHAHKRPWRTKADPSTIRKDEQNFPGGCVSVDQIVSGQTGMVPQTSGFRALERYVGATVFVDNYSSFVFVYMMKSLSTEETMAAKHAFERVAHSHGVKILSYRADNGRFADESFKKDCELQTQELTFCGVGAHHQNGIAERMIQTLTGSARAMLVHAISVWPEAITISLWPYALYHASDRHNRLHIDKFGYTPLERFARTRSPLQPDIFHTWGAPIYVLDSRNQSGPCLVPKWEPRSKLGIYLGFSPCHSRDVALVMSPTTGNLSPQFHVVFDDEFSTLPFLRQQQQPPHWSQLVNQSRYLATDQNFELSNTWETIPTPTNHSPRIPETEGANNADRPCESEGGALAQNQDFRAGTEGASDADRPCESEGGALAHNQDFRESEGDVPATARTDDIPENPVPRPAAADNTTDLAMPKFVNPDSVGLRRSERSPKPRKIFTLASFFSFFEVYQSKLASDSQVVRQPDTLSSDTVIDGTINYMNPIYQVFAAKADNETYTFSDMKRQKDYRDFIKAMEVEIADHTNRKHWVVRMRSECNFPKTILAVWSFKRKRFPDGSLNKHKARLCAHGGMQQWGIHYWETFAPVVNWLSVRLVLVLAIVYDLPVKSIDFVLAFPQSELDVPIFMELPPGFHVPTGEKGQYIVELKKSLYGLKQSGLNWYEKLKQGLEKRGFVSSKVDPCVFISEKVIVLTYVDDCIIMGKTEDDIKNLFKSLNEGDENYDFTDEGDLKNYLGVEFTRHDDGKMELKQKFLIERIIKALGFKEDLTGKNVNPVAKPSLHKDESGPPRKHQWHYRSLIGMLNYLEKTSRPEIAYAVHQCARFCENPKLSHERAVHRIVRYLTTTKDKGLIFKPDKSKGIVCHVDADFAGNWNLAEGDNPASVLSRTGFIITYANCPLIWASRLQSEISLSTTEAEYIALSTAMKEIIPLINILSEIKRHFKVIDDLPEIHCKLFEDNKSALALAKAPQMNPRTKYISLKYHHFRSYVANKLVTILPIATDEQTADIFTKVLPDVKFFHLRKKLCGY